MCVSQCSSLRFAMADKAACLDTCMCYADPVERAAAAAELAFVNAANPFAG